MVLKSIGVHLAGIKIYHTIFQATSTPSAGAVFPVLDNCTCARTKNLRTILLHDCLLSVT